MPDQVNECGSSKFWQMVGMSILGILSLLVVFQAGGKYYEYRVIDECLKAGEYRYDGTKGIFCYPISGVGIDPKAKVGKKR